MHTSRYCNTFTRLCADKGTWTDTRGKQTHGHKQKHQRKHTHKLCPGRSPNAPVRPPPGQRRHPQRRRHRRRRRRQRNNKRLSYPITSTWKSCGPTEVTLEDHGSRTHLRRRKERLRLVALSGEAGRGGRRGEYLLSLDYRRGYQAALPPSRAANR